LVNLGVKTDKVFASVLDAGGQVALENVRSNLASAVSGDRSTGELLSSLGLTPADVDRKGNHNVKIGFNEPRRNQYKAKRKRSYYVITNAMIANVIEYGRHGRKAKPFLKPAQSKSRKPVLEAMRAKMESEMANL